MGAVIGLLMLLFVLAICAIVKLSPRNSPDLYSKLILFPHRFALGLHTHTRILGIDREDAIIPTASGRNLHGWFFRAPNSRKVVLFCHANVGNVATWADHAKSALRSGWSFLVFDYQGFGKSEGKVSFDSICADGLAAYKYLLTLGYSRNQIVVYGVSIGSRVACHLVSKNDCAGLILRGAFDNFADAVSRVSKCARLIPRCLFFQNDVDNVKALRGFARPLLIIHSAFDEYFSLGQAERLFKAVDGPRELVILQHSTHSFVIDEDEPVHDKSIEAFLRNIETRA